MEIYLIGAVFAGAALFVVIVLLRRDRENKKSFENFAQSHGHQLHEAKAFGYPSVSGVQEGFEFEIAAGVAGMKDDEFYTSWCIYFAPEFPTRFSISSEREDNFFNTKKSGQDIRLGVPRFDNQFQVQGRLPASVRALFANEGALDVVESFLNTYPHRSEVTHAHLRFYFNHLITSEEELARHLDFAVAIARQLEQRLDRNLYKG